MSKLTLVKNIDMDLVAANGGNQVPSSAARWQNQLQICFEKFIYLVKIFKIVETPQLLKLEKNKQRFGILRILYKKLMDN